MRHLWEAQRLGLGQANIQEMEFPAMGLQEAMAAFTELAYGKRLRV